MPLSILLILIDLPFSPSDLPWWGWLLCALGCCVLSVIGQAKVTYDSVRGKGGRGYVGKALIVLGGAACFICAVIGVVRFVKWVWVG